MVWLSRRTEVSHPLTCNFIVLTATAMKATKSEILSTLHLSEENVKFIEQSPDSSNLKYTVQYLDENEPLEVAFSALIAEIKIMGETQMHTNIARQRSSTLVYFECSKCSLEESFHGGKNCKTGLLRCTMQEHQQVSKTTFLEIWPVKMVTSVLILTVAFGMGVNCKAVRSVVHFGPSKSVELYVQECGRAGRDGLPNKCVLLYNGMLSAHVEKDMTIVTIAEEFVNVAMTFVLIYGVPLEMIPYRRWYLARTKLMQRVVSISSKKQLQSKLLEFTRSLQIKSMWKQW